MLIFALTCESLITGNRVALWLRPLEIASVLSFLSVSLPVSFVRIHLLSALDTDSVKFDVSLFPGLSFLSLDLVVRAEQKLALFFFRGLGLMLLSSGAEFSTSGVGMFFRGLPEDECVVSGCDFICRLVLEAGE